ADLALAGRDDAGAVRPDEPAVGLGLQEAHGPGHVEDGDALGNGDDKADTGLGGLHDGVRGGGRRHDDHAGVGPGLAHRLGDGVEDVEAFQLGAALPRLDAADDLGAVVAALLGVKGTGLAEALAEDAGVFVNQDAHYGLTFVLQTA